MGDIRFTGQSSLWHTADGITLGTTLAQLQKLNGGPFKFSGFMGHHSGIELSNSLPRGIDEGLSVHDTD